MSTAIVESWVHRTAVVNDVRLHYVEAGDGPLVLLLHGFPEFWYSWRHQLPALAAAGFHVLAPDLRGYNESDKPRGVDRYRLELLAADVAALIHHTGHPRAHIAGHDWGGAIAWTVAVHHPEIVDRLAILNAPHPAVFQRALRTFDQMLRSWYMLLFQLPVLPETLIRAGNYSSLEHTLRHDTVHPDAFSPEDIRRYKKALDQPGALTAALNYYRAAFRHRRQLFEQARPVAMPTLLIWGEHDRYAGNSLVEAHHQWVRDLRIERISDASHWVQNDTPEKVNRALLAFLRASP
jgi:pimeloyl-ACP methyl ester carboxylesterase